MDINDLSRRDFLKTTGKAALAGAAALSFGSLPGCAGFPKEPREEVAKLKVMSFTGNGNNEVSICKVTSGSIAGVKIDQLIVQEL